MSAALLLAFALAAGPLEQLREEQAPLFRVLESDGVAFFWDQAIVLDVNVAGKAMTSVNLSGELEDREGVAVSLTAMGEKGALQPMMLGILPDPEKLTEKGAEATMVAWSFLEHKLMALAMTTGATEVTPAAMSPEEAETLFKAHLPRTFAYLQEQSPEEPPVPTGDGDAP
ncbi:hypothetical protein ODE01S_01120 [Oceanithermus desulfurans NBRC 100063]|uniref:Uncharacterized protein n=2 Tax=Oceanithermus desulfurans TaxID=227924 RepID=A0A511RGB1_9DEIN|nr:hypothetical protein ODE01S_01120 [Oceanithermus desulfurans NBRC 100063]